MLRRQKHVLSQSTTPFACTLVWVACCCCRPSGDLRYYSGMPDCSPCMYCQILACMPKSQNRNHRIGNRKRGSSNRRGSAPKVPEGHNPRGTTLREALRGNLPLRGCLGASAGVSSRVLRGSAGLCGGPRHFPRVVALSL